MRRTRLLDAFEDELIRRSPVDLQANRRLFEAMYRLALSRGVLPPRDPLDGIEVDIRLARALHVRTPAG